MAPSEQLLDSRTNDVERRRARAVGPWHAADARTKPKPPASCGGAREIVGADGPNGSGAVAMEPTDCPDCSAEEGANVEALEGVPVADAARIEDEDWDADFGGHWPLNEREIVAINTLIQMHRGYLARSKRVWLAGLALAIVIAAAVVGGIAWDVAGWLDAVRWPTLLEQGADGSWILPGILE